MPEIADAYRATRGRVRDLLAAAPADAATRMVPAAPDWTVHDVVAHLAGVATDLVEGRLDGVATDPWTAAQVARGRGRSIDDLLAEWDEHGAAVDAFADALGPSGGQLVFDATTHEHDVRGALGNTDARGSDAIAIGFAFATRAIGRARTRADAPALLIAHDAGEAVVGEGEPGARLTVSRFELVRAASGRRSLHQLRAYAWEGDARAELLPLAPAFAPRSEALAE
jgi:uncharacterized protein (TIGR03083 family)